VSAKVVPSLKKALERRPGRLLDRSILRDDFVFVKGGAVGVNVDDCVGRRLDCYCLLYFITDTLFLWLILTIWKNDNSFLPSGSNDILS
jgi:hypothetical protein